MPLFTTVQIIIFTDKLDKAFDATYGKVGRNASEEVLFALLKSKCLPLSLCRYRYMVIIIIITDNSNLQRRADQLRTDKNVKNYNQSPRCL